ncbi:MAG: hypothetical protein Q3980_16435 [Turicibacter sp.]|nr:hypothetical protein [Turicibacter sp.]
MNTILESKDKNIDLGSFFGIKDQFSNILNKPEYFKEMYHQTNQGIVCHHDVHNLYGYNMTRAASEAFDKRKSHVIILTCFFYWHASITRNISLLKMK